VRNHLAVPACAGFDLAFVADGCSDECVSARIETGVFVAMKIFFSTSYAVPVALAVLSLAGSNRAADTEPQKEH
jgi:hypothetical protein